MLTTDEYKRLHRIVSRLRRGERAGRDNQTTVVLHDTLVRMLEEPAADSLSEDDRMTWFAHRVRQTLVDTARREGAQKRGGRHERVFIDLVEIPGRDLSRCVDLLDLDAAMTDLEKEQPRAAEVIQLLFFADCTHTEIARRLAIGEDRVRRDRTLGLSWIHRKLGGK